MKQNPGESRLRSPLDVDPTVADLVGRGNYYLCKQTTIAMASVYVTSLSECGIFHIWPHEDVRLEKAFPEMVPYQTLQLHAQDSSQLLPIRLYL